MLEMSKSTEDDPVAHFLSTYLPLSTACRWLRGNHHGHSTRSDGTDEPLAVMRAYEAAGCVVMPWRGVSPSGCNASKLIFYNQFYISFPALTYSGQDASVLCWYRTPTTKGRMK